MYFTYWPVATILIAIGQVSLASNNFHISVAPYKKECFREDLQLGDQLGLSFQVYGGETLELDFLVYDPHEVITKSAFRSSTGSFLVDANKAGEYKFCLSNVGGAYEKLVSFSVNGPDEQRKLSEKEKAAGGAKNDAKEGLAKEVQELTAAISKVTDEQAYIRQRLLRHHETAASTNSRVLYWTFIEALIIAGVIGFQLVYITQFFAKKTLI